MLQYEIARKLYDEIKTGATQRAQTPFAEFYKLFLKSAVAYAGTRSSWSYMTQTERNEADKGRRTQHDGFLSMLSAISRNLGIENLEELLPDRKTKGDFACYVALFLGLEQR